MSNKAAPRLPAEPLVALVERRGGPGALEWTEGGSAKHLASSFYRARRTGGLTHGAADKLAHALGYHPSEIWGDMWAAS